MFPRYNPKAEGHSVNKSIDASSPILNKPLPALPLRLSPTTPSQSSVPTEEGSTEPVEVATITSQEPASEGS